MEKFCHTLKKFKLSKLENSLNKIINKKKQKLNELKKTTSIESLKNKIKENITFINFKKKLKVILSITKYRLSQRLKKQVLLLES